MRQNVQSVSSIEAEKQYLLEPNVLQSIYYQVGNSSNFVIGAFEIVEVPFGVLSVSNCLSNELVGGVLDVLCMGDDSVDSVSSLVYDLSVYVPNPNSRIVTVKFSLVNVNTGNVGIVSIEFEKSKNGLVHSEFRVVVVPPSFMYLGGRQWVTDWLEFVGKILILVCSCIFLLVMIFLTITRKMQINILNILFSVSACLSISSISYAFGVLATGPLLDVDLGIVQYVDLEWVADSFLKCQEINSVNIVLFVNLICVYTFENGVYTTCLKFAAGWTVSLVAFSTLLNIAFPTQYSFSDSFLLLLRVAVGNVTRNDFENWSRNNFSFVCIIFGFVLVYIWWLALLVAILLYRPVVVDPNSALNSAPNSAPTSAPNSASSVTVVDKTTASIEMLAGKALFEMETVHSVMEKRFSEIRERLDTSAQRIRGMKKVLE